MSKTVTVIIPVFGDIEYFGELAKRAYDSVVNQTVQADSILISVGTTMQDARNTPALNSVNTDHIIFLDADDTLDPHYIENITKFDGDIVVPAVHRLYEDGTVNTDQAPYLPKDFMVGNYIVVAALIKTDLFRKLGGFHDYEALEDWDFFMRAQEAGATFVQGTTAIYQIHVRPNSRNTSDTAHDIVLNNAKKRRNLI